MVNGQAFNTVNILAAHILLIYSKHAKCKVFMVSVE